MHNLINQLPLQASFIPSIDKGMTTGQKYMLMLHGRGDNMESYRLLAKEINVTGLNYILLNAPAQMELGFSWYHDSFDLKDELYQHSIALLLQSIDLIRDSGIALENLFILGFSQGARMALDCFFEHGSRLAGVCALSPRMSTYHDFSKISEDCLKTPLFSAHGQLDPVIPYEETKEAMATWSKHIEDIQFHSYSMAHEIDIAEIQELRAWLNQNL